MEQSETPLATPPSEESSLFTSYEELADRVILNGFGTIISSTSVTDLRARSNSSSSASSKNSSNKSYSNVIYRKGFLLAYRLYSTPTKLFATWKSHFDIHAGNRDPDDSKVTNIMEFIREWISMYLSSDFSTSMRTSILSLVDKLSPETKIRFKLLLVKSMSAHNQNRFTSQPIPKPPPSEYMDDVKKFQLIDLTPASAAHTLTMFDFNLFRKVLPKELLNTSWQNEDKLKSAPNVTQIISRFNELSYWVATEIIIQKDFKMRRKVLKRFIKIAKECELINNFNTCMAILSGLNNVAVQRLRSLWDSLSDKSNDLFQSMDVLMRSVHNFRTYRDEVKHRKPPLLPYFGIYLRDLIFTTTGNEPFLGTGGINYEFIQMLWHTVEEIQFYQSKPYKFETEWVAEQVLVARPLRVFDDETLYSLSKKSEPVSLESSFLDLNEISPEATISISNLRKAALKRRMTISPGDTDDANTSNATKPTRSRSLGDKRNSVLHLNKMLQDSHLLKILDPNLSNLKMKSEKKKNEENEKRSSRSSMSNLSEYPQNTSETEEKPLVQ